MVKLTDAQKRFVDNWPEDKTVPLIEQFRKQECLWNPRSTSNRKRHVRNMAWKSIAKTLGIDLAIVKYKITNLKQQYRNEKRKLLDNNNDINRVTRNEQWTSKWVYFSHLEFLDQTMTKRSYVYVYGPSANGNGQQPTLERAEIDEAVQQTIQSDCQMELPVGDVDDQHESSSLTFSTTTNESDGCEEISASTSQQFNKRAREEDTFDRLMLYLDGKECARREDDNVHLQVLASLNKQLNILQKEKNDIKQELQLEKQNWALERERLKTKIKNLKNELKKSKHECYF